jgi:hypothetical protein
MERDIDYVSPKLSRWSLREFIGEYSIWSCILDILLPKTVLGDFG